MLETLSKLFIYFAFQHNHIHLEILLSLITTILCIISIKTQKTQFVFRNLHKEEIFTLPMSSESAVVRTLEVVIGVVSVLVDVVVEVVSVVVVVDANSCLSRKSKK